MSVRNLDAVFRPQSVAVIGASRESRSVGNVIVANLVRGGFDGPILPVNPHARAVHGVLTYPSVKDLPVTPDLAVVATPAPSVPGIVDELGRRGTRGVIVVSAGFGELGGEGRALQQAMLDAAKPHLLRIVGPNCIGAVVPRHGLNASFLHCSPLAGDLAFVSQSGAVLSTVLDWASARRIGFSCMVSLGGMADVDFGDMLDFLLADPHTRAILLYVEAITHARKFMSAARAASRTKPVVVIKAGRTGEAARAAASHTGALAGEDEIYEAAFERAGMLRVFDLDELFAAVETLGTGLRVGSDRLAIVSNGGGLAVLATDTLVELGGRLAALRPETLERLSKVLPPTWNRANPVDIIGDADGARYRAAVETVLEDPEADALLVMNCPTAVADAVECAEAVVEVGRQAKKPLLTSWLGEATAREARRRFVEAGIATYGTPREAVQGFVHLVRWHRNQQLLLEVPSAVDLDHRIDRARARETLSRVLAAGREWLTEPEAKEVLEAYAIPTVRTVEAPDVEAAVRAAQRFGVPVALKIVSPDIVHKSDVGGVELGLETPEAVREAARRMLRNVQRIRPEARIQGFSVQEMASMPDSIELVLGAKTDPLFGPVLLFGAGGIAVEVLRDRAVALPPLNPELARRTMAKTRIWRLLQGWRHRPPAAIDAIALTFVKLGQLVVDQDLIDEMDINPLLANANGVLALDARIRVREPERRGTARLAIVPYPRELERLVTLRDGTPVRLRPIRPEDAPALQEMIAKSDLEDLRMRFFMPMKQLPPALAARLTQIDYDREMAFVAFPDGREDGMWGVGRLAADPDRARAEFALLVRSDVKDRGLGLRLLQTLIEHAQRMGVRELWGEVLAENHRMLALADHFGFRRRAVEGRHDVVEVVLELG